MEKEDIESNRSIGRFGNELIKENWTILTHCNAGALATCDYGTALELSGRLMSQEKTYRFLQTKQGLIFRVQGLPPGN